MLRTKVLSEDRGFGKCKTIQVAFFISCTPRMPLFFCLRYSYDLLVCFCLGFFCAFLTLSSVLFAAFHFFSCNLRLKSDVLDHLIVLPNA